MFTSYSDPGRNLKNQNIESQKTAKPKSWMALFSNNLCSSPFDWSAQILQINSVVLSDRKYKASYTRFVWKEDRSQGWSALNPSSKEISVRRFFDF